MTWKALLIRITSVTLLCLLLAGCDIPSSKEFKELSESMNKQNGRIAPLEAKVADLASAVARVKGNLIQAEGKIDLLEQRQEGHNTAAFDPSDPGFSRIDTGVGSFVVMIKDIKPFADGTRIQFSVGNLTSASVSGLSFKVRWGARQPDINSVHAIGYLKWQQSLNEREFTPTNALLPGTWNSVSLNLPGIPPDKVGYVELSLKDVPGTTLSLIKQRQ